MSDANRLPEIQLKNDASGAYDPLASRWPQCGIMLICSANAGAPEWEILGWFGTDNDNGRVEVSSRTNAIMEIASTPGGATYTAAQTPWLLTGGEWTEIGLMVEPDAITLYRDGRRIARASTTNYGVKSLAEPLEEGVLVGVLLFGTDRIQSASIIDNVRLDRLGDAMAGTLPAGIVLSSDEMRITCHPSGRVEASPATLELSSQSDATRAKLSVDGSGNVTAEVTP